MVQIIGTVTNLAAIEGAVGTTATTVRSHRTYTHTTTVTTPPSLFLEICWCVDGLVDDRG